MKLRSLHESDESDRERFREVASGASMGASYMHSLLRSGQTTLDKIELAAFLEHPAASAWVKESEVGTPLEIDWNSTWPFPEQTWGDVLNELAAEVWNIEELTSFKIQIIEYILTNSKIRNGVRERLTAAFDIVKSMDLIYSSEEVWGLTEFEEDGFYTPPSPYGAEMGLRNFIRSMNQGTSFLDNAFVMFLYMGKTASPHLEIKKYISRLLMPDF